MLPPHLVPTLYSQQGVLTTNRALARAEIILQDQQNGGRAEWLVLSRRTAYWPPEIVQRLRLPDAQRVAIRSRQGFGCLRSGALPTGRARTGRRRPRA